MVNGPYRSPVLRQYITRALSGARVAAADRGGQRLYVRTLAASSTATSDLELVDLNTGDLLQTVRASHNPWRRLR